MSLCTLLGVHLSLRVKTSVLVCKFRGTYTCAHVFTLKRPLKFFVLTAICPKSFCSWVEWLLELPVLRHNLPEDSEEEKKKGVHRLMCDFQLLIHAVHDVCFNNCLGFSLVPEALNKGNWLGKLVQVIYECLDEIESQ